MANRSGLLPTVALLGLLAAPGWAATNDEPVATAPIPPPPAAAPSASAPDKPAFVSPNPPKPSAPKAAAAPAQPAPAAKRTLRTAAKAEHDKKSADRHRPSQHAKKEQPHIVAHTAPAGPTPPPFVRRAPPRPRYYASMPPPPPWYDRDMPFAGYYPGPWHPGMMRPW